jgi:hypothetical protein
MAGWPSAAFQNEIVPSFVASYSNAPFIGALP